MPMDQSTLVDVENGLSRVRGNKKLYARMLRLFLDSDEFNKLEDALQRGDYATAGDAAHTIKGMTGNLSLNAIFERSAELMLQLRSGLPQEETLAAYRTALEDTRAVTTELITSMED